MTAVGIGSGGAIQGRDYILDRLPLAQGNLFRRQFLHLKGIATEGLTRRQSADNVII